jgi:hypothetical protein
LVSLQKLTSLFGAVFAFEGRTKLETLAENLRDLHADIPSFEWTDMVVVLDEGLIAFYVQFPFQPDQMAGLFMPPASPDFLVPPLYAQLMANRQGEFTLNRFFAALAAQLVFFRRRTGVPLEQMLAGAPKQGLTIQGYWCTTDRRFVAVPPEQHVDKHEGLVEEVEIYDPNDTPVGLVGWMPWADGHVVVFQGPGQPPPELVTAYLPANAKVFPGSTQRVDIWVSQVLPGLPSSFVSTSLDLVNRTGFKYSARTVRALPERPRDHA